MAVAGAGELAAVGAVVVGRDEERGVRVNRLAVKGQVLDALGCRVDALAFAVVACRLGHINLIIDTVDYVEVVGTETVPVNQRLRLAVVRVNLVELPGGALQPLFHLFAAGFHHHQGVRVEIEVGGITEGELAFFYFDVACRIVLTSTDFERRGSRKHRQFCQIRVALNKVLNVGFLRHVHHLHGRVVLHQRQVAVHIVGRLADRLADKLAGGIVVGLQCINQLVVFCRQRFLRCRIVNRACLRLRGSHLPFAAVVVQHQVNHAQMVAPHSRHYRGNAVKRAFGNIRPFDAGEVFAREHRVRVAKHNGIDARHLA